MANEAIFKIDVPGLEKLQEAGALWKGISAGGTKRIDVAGRGGAVTGGMGAVANQWKKIVDSDAVTKLKLADKAKKVWDVTSRSLTSFAKSLVSWSKWAVAGVAGGLFGLGRLAAGVKSDMQQGKATGTSTHAIMAWEKAFKDAGLGGEGAGTSYLRAIREMQTDLQKQAYFANLGMQTGPDIKGQDTQKMALEFMRKLRESNLPAQLKDEMAGAVGLSRLDMERMKGGEFESYLKNAESVTNVSEKTAAGLAAFALQLDNLTTSIKTNIINIMGKYSGQLTAFVKKINEAMDMLARYILSGDMENDMRTFGYELVHWMNKYLPGVNISESKEAKQYFAFKEVKKAGDDFAAQMEQITKNKHFMAGTPAQLAERTQPALERFQKILNTTDISKSDKMRAIEAAARSADKVLGSRVNFTFTVAGESNASVSLKASPPSTSATPFKTGK